MFYNIYILIIDNIYVYVDDRYICFTEYLITFVETFSFDSAIFNMVYLFLS